MKARPGKVSYASAGVGNPTHLAGELFKIATGIDMQHVPYKGGNAVLPDLLAGRVIDVFLVDHDLAGRTSRRASCVPWA